ncbi:MAG: hypothetical protein Kilf2KO_39710 [Rhodospirillales bacterium]
MAVASLLGAGLLVMGCTQQPLPGVDPTPPRTEPPPPIVNDGALPPPVLDGASAIPSGESAVPASTVRKDSSGWSGGSNPDQHQADLQSCYAFANAQVRHDEQINDDRSTLYGGNNPAQAGNLYSYEKAIRPYGNEQRFGELFRGCMSSRGYQRN